MAGTDWKPFEFSSGVKGLYGPFPHGLYWDIMGNALDQYPDPEMPKREIEVLGGTEEVDDDKNPQYLEDLRKARLARYGILVEASLDMCIEIEGWPEQWADELQKTIKYAAQPPPEDPDKLKIWFLEKFALRTKEDWKIIGRIQRFSQIDDEEVRRQAEQFPGDVEGPEGAGVDAPGPVEE